MRTSVARVLLPLIGIKAAAPRTEVPAAQSSAEGQCEPFTDPQKQDYYRRFGSDVCNSEVEIGFGWSSFGPAARAELTKPLHFTPARSAREVVSKAVAPAARTVRSRRDGQTYLRAFLA